MLIDLLGAAVETLKIATLAAIGALVLSPVAALGRISVHAPVRCAAGLYIEVFRGTSALVQLYFAFFALPLLGVTLSPIVAGVAVLALNTGSYGAEFVRGALLAVPRTQREAATVLGMSPAQAMRRVVFPQAVLPMVPPFTNLMIDLLKNTTLVSLITLTDLTARAQDLRNQSGGAETAEIFALVVGIYFVLAQLIALTGRLLERRLARGRDVGRAVALPVP